LPGLAAGLLAFGFMHLPALAQALGFGQPGQGFIFFHFLQNRCCITRSYLLQTVISKGDTDMAKIHLRANKLTSTNAPLALCAAKPKNNGKLTNNARSTYRFMASEIVSYDDYKNTQISDRCAHCQQEIPYWSAKRVALGLRPWSAS
jgi:hypothetical protein